MLCYQVNLLEVEFKANNKDAILDALKSIAKNIREVSNAIYCYVDGYDVTIDFKGKRIITESIRAANKVKRTYSQFVIKAIAKKKKWALKKKKANKFQLRRY